MLISGRQKARRASEWVTKRVWFSETHSLSLVLVFFGANIMNSKAPFELYRCRQIAVAEYMATPDVE